MTRKLLAAVILIGLTVLVLVVNRGSVSVDLIAGGVNASKPIVFLAFTAVGVVIGSLLR